MIDLESSPVYFAEEVLGISLYPWQDKVLTWFEAAPQKRVKASLCTPNGAGKSERVVATLVLYWLAMFPQGKAIVTTKSGLQLDTQVCPAIERHRQKFQKWKFIERRIETPTGGLAIFFVTDETGRAEGHHPAGDPLDGPVLLIVDEAKSVPEDIFEALDRCTYNALLYVSSTGKVNGRFYDSQTKPEMGFHRLKVGLADCPHIPKERIDDIIATYGIDHPFTRSTLFAEFMVDDGEARFGGPGIKLLTDASAEFERLDGIRRKSQPALSAYGELADNAGRITWQAGTPTESWLWCCEPPEHGFSYIAWCDPMTGEQSAGSKKRDTHAAGIIRDAYIDNLGKHHDPRVVAILHHQDAEGEVACRWDNDILSERLYQLVRWYGHTMVIVEANNAGVEVLRLLAMAGASLWKREKRDHKHPGKKMDVVGFQTSATTKSLWIGAVGAHIREETLICEYPRACHDFAAFILDEAGRGCAQDGSYDDFVTGIGLGLYAKGSAQRYNAAMAPVVNKDYQHTGVYRPFDQTIQAGNAALS